MHRNLWRGVLKVVTVVTGVWKPCFNRKWKLWLTGTGLVCGNSKMLVHNLYNTSEDNLGLIGRV